MIPGTISTLHMYLEGLSPKAQALAAVGYILSTQSQSGTFSIGELRGVFDMTDDDEFNTLFDELYDNATMYFVGGGHDEAEVMFAQDLLSVSVGPPGRPAAKHWARQRERLEQLLDGQEPFCIYCRAESVPLAIDHLRPVSRGGSNHVKNLAFACVPCNSAKRDKTYQEFSAWRKARGL